VDFLGEALRSPHHAHRINDRFAWVATKRSATSRSVVLVRWDCACSIANAVSASMWCLAISRLELAPPGRDRFQRTSQRDGSQTARPIAPSANNTKPMMSTTIPMFHRIGILMRIRWAPGVEIVRYIRYPG